MLLSAHCSVASPLSVSCVLCIMCIIYYLYCLLLFIVYCMMNLMDGRSGGMSLRSFDLCRLLK